MILNHFEGRFLKALILALLLQSSCVQTDFGSFNHHERSLMDTFLHSEEIPLDRWEAGVELYRLAHHRAVPVFLEGLKSDEWVVRECALRLLGRLKTYSAADRILGCLSDSESGVRAYAAQVLGEWHMAQFRPDIEQLLVSDPDSLVRGTAVLALGELGMRESCGAISNYVQAHSDSIVETINGVDSLARIGCESELRQLSHHSRIGVRILASVELLKRGGHEGRSVLVEAVSELLSQAQRGPVDSVPTWDSIVLPRAIISWGLDDGAGITRFLGTNAELAKGGRTAWDYFLESGKSLGLELCASRDTETCLRKVQLNDSRNFVSHREAMETAVTGGLFLKCSYGVLARKKRIEVMPILEFLSEMKLEKHR